MTWRCDMPTACGGCLEITLFVPTERSRLRPIYGHSTPRIQESDFDKLPTRSSASLHCTAHAPRRVRNKASPRAPVELSLAAHTPMRCAQSAPVGMRSVKTVAQRPRGNYPPLSSLGTQYRTAHLAYVYVCESLTKYTFLSSLMPQPTCLRSEICICHRQVR